MKTLALIFVVLMLFVSFVHAENPKQKGLHDMHMMMHMMDMGLRKALEGSNLQMLGQMEMSEKLSKDAMVRGTKMVEEGKILIKEILEGEAMKKLHKEGGFDKKIMKDLEELGNRMLKVIEQIEKLHEGVKKQLEKK